MKLVFKRGLAVALVFMLTTGLGVTSTTAETTPQLSLTSITPTWLATKTNIVLSFSISTQSSLPDAVVEVLQSNSPLSGRSEIAAANKDGSGFASRIIKSENLGTIGSGVSNKNIVVPKASLTLPRAGVYVLQLVLRGGGKEVKNSILLPYIPNARGIKPLQVVTLLSISASPSITAEGTLLNDDAATQFATERTLQSLVGASKDRTNLTWLLDPDLVSTAKKVIDGTEISQPKPHDVTGEQSEAAIAWLEELQENSKTIEVFATPFASADINGLINRNFQRLAKVSLNSKKDLQETLGVPFLFDAVIASNNDFDKKTWSWLDEASAELVVVGSDRYPSTSNAFTSSGLTDVETHTNVLVRDLEISERMRSSLVDDSQNIKDQQAFISDLLMTTLEAPSLSRVLVLHPNTNTSGITFDSANQTLEILELPWISTITVNQAKAVKVVQNRTPITTDIEAAFNRDTVADMNRLRNKMSDLNNLLRGSTQQISMTESQLRIASDNFNELNDRAQLRKIAITQIKELENSVKIMSVGSVIFPQETSVVPITIRNDLDVPVTIKVRAVGEPSVRVTAEDVGEIIIQPGKRKSIEIPTRLVGSDSANLVLRLTDVNGKQFGDFVSIELASSAYSTAAAWVVGLAFALLLVLVVINTVRRIRVHRVESRNMLGHGSNE